MPSEYEYNQVSVTEKNEEKADKPAKYGYGVRNIQVLIFLLCLTVNIMGRGHMGVTIVAMTYNTELSTTANSSLHFGKNQSDLNLTETELEFEITNRTTEDIIINNGTQGPHTLWNWPKPVQEMILNAFFLGYAIMMFPMGMVCQRYGGKLPLQIALLVNGVVSIITPWVTLWGDWKGICACRTLQGLSQAGTYPSMQNILAKWIPENERATLSSLVHSGLTIGTIIGYQLAGLLGASAWGWPSIFYAIGVIFLISFLILTQFGAPSPLQHKTIKYEELNYIVGAANDGDGKKLKTPWRAILTSKAAWGTMITHAGFNIAFVFFFNNVPTYIHYSLNIDVKNSGLLSSLPYVASIFTNVWFGWISDYCINHNIVSKSNTRRICNSIGSFGLVLCLLLTSYTSNMTIVMACLIIATFSTMGSITGWMVNYVDLAPNFAGSILATGNTLSNCLVVLTPVVVSYVVTDMTNIIQWRIMFCIIAGVSIFTGCVFLLLMSADVQPWNYAEPTESCLESTQEESKENNKCDEKK